MTTSPFSMKWSEMEDDDSEICFTLPQVSADAPVTPVKQIQAAADVPMPATKGKGALTADRAVDSLNVSPIKADASSLTSAHEIVVECSIPYKMKSFCSVATSQQHNISNGSIAATEAAGRANSTPISRQQRAVEAIQKALRENSDEMNYNDLMKACNWRARFQPSLGSLFTFLKKHPDYFSYKHAIVRLVPREVIVNELLSLSWK